MEEGKRLINLSHVCSMLGVDSTTKIKSTKGRPTPMVITSGFPLNAPFKEIKSDLFRVQESLMVPNYEISEGFARPDEGTTRRIPINRLYDCTIL